MGEDAADVEDEGDAAISEDGSAGDGTDASNALTERFDESLLLTDDFVNGEACTSFGCFNDNE